MLLKKRVLATAIFMAISGAAFAENEAVIEQLDDTSTASTATIEQVFTDATQSQFAQVTQNVTTTASVSVYQGVTDAAAAIDPTAPATSSPSATAIDPTSTVYADGLGYAPVYSAVTNYVVVRQDGSSNAVATVIQATGDEVATLPDVQVSIGSGTAGITSGAVNDGVVDITLGTFASATTVNSGNIAAVGQGAAVLDRGGNSIGGGAQGDAYDSEVALILQSGSGHIAQIQQEGDSQAAVVIQDGVGNNAFIGQFGGTNNAATITQLASNDVGTIYQTGDTQSARIYQRTAQ